MTRKRTKESIGQVLCEPCFYCDGEGYLKSKQTVCYEILRELERDRKDLFGQNINVTVHPEVAACFYDEERVHLEKVEERLHSCIVVKGESAFHLDQFEITVLDTQGEG